MAEWMVFDAVTVPVLLYQGAQIQHANPAMCRLLGCTPSELRGLQFDIASSQEDQERLRRYLLECMGSADEPPALELTLLTGQQALRVVEVSARRIVLGTELTVVLTCQDLSDIQHVQNSMMYLSQLLNQIINSGPVATFVIDTSHRITQWNRACEHLSGMMASDMRGSTEPWRGFYASARPVLADLIVDGASAAELKARYGNAIWPSQTVEGAWESEGFIAEAGQHGRWYFFTAAPLRDVNGELIGAIETLQDISRRREAEDELRRHRNELEKLVQERTAELGDTLRQLEAFMEAAPIGIVYSVGDRVQRNNRTMAAMFGIVGGSAVGLRGRAFFLSRRDWVALRRVARETLAQGLPMEHEMWLKHQDGSPLWMQVIAYAADPAHPEAGTWWMLQDRTAMRATQDELQAHFERIRETNNKLEEAQNQLLQSEKMASVGQLAAGVAHEINNPIGFVGSNLNTLKTYVGDLLGLIDAFERSRQPDAGSSDAETPEAIMQRIEIDYLREDLPQLLAESEDGLARVKKIVQDLKDFSRVDQSDWQEADLNAGLESTLNVVMHELKYKAEVVKRLKPLPLVRCLAAQLNQVFMNLIVNASHAIDQRGTITLSTGCDGYWAWVQVQDTGCGMTEEVQRRIFEPFYTTKPVGKGTGLGLSLSFSIVKKHGGALRVRSAPGEGSRFRVWVPMQGPTPESALINPPDHFED
jgi:two-component system NtrC family sensor kinase